MLARRTFIAAAFNAAAIGMVTTPTLAVAQGRPADQRIAAYPPSTGSPRTRGPAGGARPVTAAADAERAIRSSGSPARRGHRPPRVTEATVAPAAALR